MCNIYGSPQYKKNHFHNKVDINTNKKILCYIPYGIVLAFYTL